MASLVKKTGIILGLLILSGWLLWYGGASWIVHHKAHEFKKNPGPARFFSDGMYDYGLNAWQNNQHKRARDYFKQSAYGNVLNMKAWLKLAQVESVLGNKRRAVRLLRFVHRETADTSNYKWDQVLLASELGAEDIFIEHINAVIGVPGLKNDALMMLDQYFKAEIDRIVAVLSPGRLDDYLEWLMRWKRTEDSWQIWQEITAEKRALEAVYEPYARFLLRQREIEKAVSVWKEQSGVDGVFNPGFESELSGRVFGWSYRQSRQGLWEIERTTAQALRGRHALRIVFNGQKNINFSHVSQLVPVQPGASYEISFYWKSRKLSTDNRPFIAVSGYACEGRWQSGMVGPDTGWQQQVITFRAPDGCHAVKITLRREPSRKFDSKIRGELFVDDFDLRVIKEEGLGG